MIMKPKVTIANGGFGKLGASEDRLPFVGCQELCIVRSIVDFNENTAFIAIRPKRWEVEINEQRDNQGETIVSGFAGKRCFG